MSQKPSKVRAKQPQPTQQIVTLSLDEQTWGKPQITIYQSVTHALHKTSINQRSPQTRNPIYAHTEPVEQILELQEI
ncbi:hypothetical protein [Ktedonospora formicarum]|uniref:Uncharacterized protein n=1 Tax=Ktedonospora formicarum TaxID=2778364 RepID=A0A8J3MRS0_9CHLR|nr:hypothetical protein [Ktedonospora formicarum]GHO45280.1 hypothetical protein KSX_34430 [Ktedonospora formicarum]